MNSLKKLVERNIYIIDAIFNYLPYLLLLFFVFSFLFRNDLSFNEDLGRHLKLGQIILQTLNVPKINLFSYTNPNFPFINHHWLFEVITYLSSISIGLEALLIIKVISLLVTVFIILILAKKTKSVLFIPISFLFLHLLRGNIEIRPEILSFLFTALTLYFLDRFEKKDSKLIYFLPFISLIWVNWHIYFPVGIFLQLVFLMDLIVKKFIQKNASPDITRKLKVLSIITGLCIVSSLINPSLLKGALYPFTFLNNYGATVTENQTIFTLISVSHKDQNFLFYYICGFIVLLSIYLSLWKKPDLKSIMLCLLGLVLATQAIKGFPYLVLISLPAVLKNLNYQKSNILTKMLNAIVVVLIFGEAILYFNGKYFPLTYLPNIPSLRLTESAKPALDFLLKNNLPQPIFNNFDIGSYIVYRTYPKYKVFIDGRPEAYPASFIQNTYISMQENYQVFKKEEVKYSFNTVVFSITDQNPRTINFLNLITKDPDWKIVFLDQFMLILVRNTFLDKLNLKAIDLVTLNINYYNYSSCVSYTNLSTLLYNTWNVKQAEIFNKKALKLCPNNPAANYVMSNIFERGGKNLDAALEYDAKSKQGAFW